MSEIVQAIRQIAGTHNDDKVRLLICEVNSVDILSRKCNVSSISGHASITFDAQLTAGIADGIIPTPEINSIVYVLSSKYTLPFVVLYSDIDNYVLNGGEFGGLVKVIELTDKLNKLEQKINEIILNMSTLTLPVSGATAGPPITPPISNLVETLRTELENTTVNHGG